MPSGNGDKKRLERGFYKYRMGRKNTMLILKMQEENKGTYITG